MLLRSRQCELLKRKIIIILFIIEIDHRVDAMLIFW